MRPLGKNLYLIKSLASQIVKATETSWWEPETYSLALNMLVHNVLREERDPELHRVSKTLFLGGSGEKFSSC